MIDPRSNTIRPGGQNLTFGLLDQLGRDIVTGKYKDSSFPTEAELAKAHGVSRSVTREAVKMLAAKGLVSARPRQGTAVHAFSNWNLLDPDVLRWMLERSFSLELLHEFTDLRAAIEPQAAALAASRADEEDVEAIRAALDRMESADRGEDDPLAADIDFHVSILRASKNLFFAQFRDVIRTALPMSVRYTANRGHHASISEHRAVANAIKKRNPTAAAKSMSKLIEDVQKYIDRADGR